MNILILAAGSVNFNADDCHYPLCLTELNGIPLIERLINSCRTVGDAEYTVALREQDIRRCHLDNVIKLLVPDSHIISITDITQGAACTALLAVRYINNDEELLILNGNELLEVDFSLVINHFRMHQLDAGTVVFPSIHPRYSYVRVNHDELVIEAAEKNPISRHATAGFYWFRHGKDFVRAAQNMIRKNESLNDAFYICPSFNELILEQARIGVYPVMGHQYHPLKTERHVIQYETAIEKRKTV